MKKWIVRISAGVIGAVLFFAAISAIVLATYNPNEHKDEIAAAVKRATGRDLVIAGNIGVTFFPVFGFEAEGVQLGNPPGFPEEDFLTADKVSSGVKIIALFSGNIEITKIIVQSPHINIIRQADGTNNLRPVQTRERAAAQTQAMNVRIGAVEIRNGSVTYVDRVSGKNYAIDPVNLTVPGFSRNESMPFSADMIVRQPASAATTAIDVAASVKADPAASLYEFSDIRGDVTLNPAAGAGETKISFSGDAVADIRAEGIDLKNLQASWQDSTARGVAAIHGFEKPSLSFNLALSGLDFGSSGQGRAVDGNRDLLPVETLRHLSLDGTVTADEIRAANMIVKNIEAKISGENGFIVVDPLRMDAYEGTERDRITVDVRGSVPAFSVTGKVGNVQIGPMLEDYTGHDYVTGIFGSDYSLTASGNNLKSLRETAGGTVNLSFSEGEIKKWQLSRLLNQVIAFFKEGEVNASVSDNFRFTSLNATFKGRNGVFRNDDLVLVAPASHALGSGEISLRDQTVDYIVRAGLGDDRLKFGEGKHLPITIRGPLNAPGYSLDFQAIATQALQQNLEERKDEIMDRALENLGVQEPAAGDEKNEKSPGGLIRNLLNAR